MFYVLVTFGTRTNMLYAPPVQGMRNAERMRNTAIKFGYKDASVWNEEDFKKAFPLKCQGI